MKLLMHLLYVCFMSWSGRSTDGSIYQTFFFSVFLIAGFGAVCYILLYSSISLSLSITVLEMVFNDLAIICATSGLVLLGSVLCFFEILVICGVCS